MKLDLFLNQINISKEKNEEIKIKMNILLIVSDVDVEESITFKTELKLPFQSV